MHLGGLAAFECLSESPVAGCAIHGGDDSAVAERGLEGQSSARQGAVAGELPHLAPVAHHWVPSCVGTHHLQLLHVAGAADIGDEHEQEPRVAVDLEAHAACLDAGSSTIDDGEDAADCLRELHERRVRHVEVLLGRVAPPALGAFRAVVRRRDGDGWTPGQTILGTSRITLQLVTLSATQPGVEQCRTQRCSHSPIPSRVQVPISTRPTCIPKTPKH